MKIKLDSLEITALQQVAKHPGERLNVGVGDMESYGLVELCDEGYLITPVGKLVLSPTFTSLNERAEYETSIRYEIL